MTRVKLVFHSPAKGNSVSFSLSLSLSFFFCFLFQRRGSFICWREQYCCGGDIESTQECWVETKFTLEVVADRVFRGLTLWSCCCWWENNIKSLRVDLSQGDSVELMFAGFTGARYLLKNKDLLFACRKSKGNDTLSVQILI